MATVKLKHLKDKATLEEYKDVFYELDEAMNQEMTNHIPANLVNSDSTDNSMRNWLTAILEIIKNPDHNIYLLLDETAQVIGFIELQTQGNRVVNILNIYIQETYRSKGYGTAILEHVKNIAKSNKFKTIILSVYNKNVKAFKLYESLGFIPYQVLMYTDI